MILVGDLMPGEIVTQARLSQMLGVSSMPVREALLRLSHEGFIEARSSKPFRVSTTSRGDIEAIYRAQAMLAGELTALAAQRGGGGELVDELSLIVEQWSLTDDTALLEELNWRFHRAINHAAGSPKLLVLLRTAIAFIPEHFYTLLPEWRIMSEKGHREILRAIADRDTLAASKAASQHVTDASELLIRHFTDTGYWEKPPDPAHLESTMNIGRRSKSH
jgi:DNA-binding GntR family transcriptional regulator